MEIDFKNIINFLPFTLVYLVTDNKILLLRRNSTRKIQPNKIMVPGGKIEPGESVQDSARREFKEETGLVLKDMSLWGTFSWIDNNNSNGIFYVYKATKFTGKLIEESNEGFLFWQECKTVMGLENLAVHQQYILPKILNNHYINTFSSFCFYQDGKIVHYIDSEGFYDFRASNI